MDFLGVSNRDLDYYIVENLLDWKRVHVTKMASFEGNGWKLPNGDLVPASASPHFTTDMREALTLYEKYKDDIDEIWDRSNFEVSPRSLCDAALRVNGFVI